MAFPNYAEPLGTAVPNTPPAPPAPQSTSGAITTDIGRTESATQTALATLGIESPQQGTPALDANHQPVIAGCSSVALNNYYGGSVGSTGTKFS
jgi:hypothetical protein